MAILRRQSANPGSKRNVQHAVRTVLIATVFVVFIYSSGWADSLQTPYAISLSEDQATQGVGSAARSAVSPSLIDYEVDEACKSLPFIRPMGTYFLDSKLGHASSPEGVDPAFKVGSNFGKKTTLHMGTDMPHFQLVKELLADKKGGLALDMGANQGFFTWYLASLGMEVHSFEIFEKNVKALQHGAEFNPKDVAERVNVYPVGLGQMVGRMGMGGSNYGGHLTKVNTGPILASSYDCFAYHNLKHIGDNVISNVSFVKLDVEGFEIAVLLGAKRSLFGPHGKVGGMLMEVGPSRWDRAGVTFEKGVTEMKELSEHFQKSYLIVRTEIHSDSCPKIVAAELADQNPRALNHVFIHRVKIDEWQPLLQKLKDMNGDCNFWYTN